MTPDVCTALLAAGGTAGDCQQYLAAIKAARQTAQGVETLDTWVCNCIQRLGLVHQPRWHAAVLRGVALEVEAAARKRAARQGRVLPSSFGGP